MKKIIFCVSVISVAFFSDCSSGGSKNDHAGHEMNRDSVQPATAPDDKDIKVVEVTYPNIDAKLAASIKQICDHYLHIKNALVNDDSREAANGAQAMTKAMRQVDKSFFTAEQKAIYDQNEAELKEHADHIGKNGDNIKHQRSHFSMMSELMYGLIKAFGAGQPVYHYHCPMFNENKGAMWLSETREVKNPYYGNEMLTCGSIEEVIK